MKRYKLHKAWSLLRVCRRITDPLFVLEQVALVRLNMGEPARIRAAQRDVRAARRGLRAMIRQGRK
jgi:hypothetical protein